jgi:hypothetical protein
MLVLPATLGAPVLRTDFTDDAGWEAVHAAARVPSPEGFSPDLTFVSDPAFAGLAPETAGVMPSASYRGFVFLVDHVTVTDPELPVVVVDRLHDPGRWFRVVPGQLWAIENNLSLANMDFFEFADNVDADGVFRGFRDAGHAT